MMHSRITDVVTWRNASSSSCEPFDSPLAPGSSGVARRMSCASRRSSTRNNVDAISRIIWSLATPPRSTTDLRRSISPSMSPRSSPRPSTPSVSPIFFSKSICGTSSDDLFDPVRTKISSTSLTRPRSSLIAAPTVFMSFALGADSASRACSTCSSPGSNSSRLNAARISLIRSPALPDRAT